MYIYIKKEYYTEAADFIVSLVKSKKQRMRTKFERVEEEILEQRRKSSLKKHSHSLELHKKGQRSSRVSTLEIKMTTSENLSHKKEGVVINIEPDNNIENPRSETIIDTKKEKNPQSSLEKEASSRIENNDVIEIAQPIETKNDLKNEDNPDDDNNNEDKELNLAQQEEIHKDADEDNADEDNADEDNADEDHAHNDNADDDNDNEDKELNLVQQEEIQKDDIIIQDINSQNAEIETPRIATLKSVPGETHNVEELIHDFQLAQSKSFGYFKNDS